MPPEAEKVQAAKSLQSCPTLCNPIDGSPPAPLSLGFSRQEHWSGLPFPSPVHESEKWKWSRSVVSDCLWHHGLQPTRLLCQWDSPGKSTGVGCHCLLQESTWRFLNHSLTTPSLDSTLTSLFAECLTGNCQKNVSTLSCLRRPPSPVVYGKSCIWKHLWNTLAWIAKGRGQPLTPCLWWIKKPNQTKTQLPKKSRLRRRQHVSASAVLFYLGI